MCILKFTQALHVVIEMIRATKILLKLRRLNLHTVLLRFHE